MKNTILLNFFSLFMARRGRTSTLIFCMTLLMCLGQNVRANIWRVNNNAIYTQNCTHCFSSIQSAVNSVSVLPGDTLHVEASNVNYAGVTFTKKLVIIGPGYFLNENGVLQQNQLGATVYGNVTFNAGSEGTTMLGMIISGGSANDNVLIHVNDIAIKRCYVKGYIAFSNSNVISNILITQSYIKESVYASNYFNYATVNNLVVLNNYLGYDIILGSTYNRCHGIFAQNVVNGAIEGSSGMNYYNNIITGNFIESNNSTSNVHDNIFTGSIPTWLSTGTNHSVPYATVFVSNGTSDGIYKLNSSGTCAACYQGFHASGTNNVEMGMYGGLTPYILSGIPDVPTIYKLQNNPTVHQGDTTVVSIGTRSNN